MLTAPPCSPAGLFISSSIAELHGGVLLARSDGLGRGSTLSLLLPLCCEPEPEPAAVDHDVESAGVRTSQRNPGGRSLFGVFAFLLKSFDLSFSTSLSRLVRYFVHRHSHVSFDLSAGPTCTAVRSGEHAGVS